MRDRSRPDLDGALTRLDEAVAAATALVGADAVASARNELDAVRRRHGHLGPTVVVALAGGTGSGKSSLLNALAGHDVVATGVVRPTTDRPTAWLPRDAEPGLDRLLADLGVDRRVHDAPVDDLAVIDLPDHDSVETDHRATVDALLPRVDLVVWVLDPLKYNDRAIHQRIAARSRYAEQFLFVLNRSDQVATTDLDAVRDDLIASLRADGIGDPTVLVTAAAPPHAPPAGVDALADRLHALARRKEVVAAKLAEDLRGLATDLQAATGLAGAGHEVADHSALVAAWDEARDAAAAAIATAIVDDAAITRSARAGARTAARTASGPVGRAWHRVRSGPVGRALGLPQDRAVDTAPPRPATRTRHLDAGVATLLRGVHDLSLEVDGAAGRRLRGIIRADDLERELDGAVEGARRAVSDDDRVPVRGWWRGAAVLQTLVTLAVVIGAGWWWTEPTAVRPGEVPWPVVLVVGGALLGLLLARVVRHSGARAGERYAQDHRAALADAIAAGVDDRVGAPIRDLLSERERLARLLAESHDRLASGGRWART
jgi:energy-coupling factor transporter ATP-binding protein EcfA2